MIPDLNSPQSNPNHLLIIEDNEGDFTLISEYIHEVFPSLTMQWCSTYLETKDYLTNCALETVDVILLDLILPDKSDEDLLKAVIDQSGNSIPIVILTGLNDIKKSIKAVAIGASDYLVKDELSPTVLAKSILYSIERKRTLETIKDMHSITNRLLENERKRIGRDIQENIGQQLIRLKIDLYSIKNTLNDYSPEFNKSIQTSIEMVSDLVNNIKKIVQDLRPPLLDELGLISAMESYLFELNKKIEQTLIFDFDDKQIEFDSAWAIDVYRIMQEGVANAIKHSKADLITVSCKFLDNNYFELKIEDNGIGMPSPIMEPKVNKWGIISMKESATRWQGTIQLESFPNKGTTLALYLPIKKAKW
jgi:signal transduction histidine kinase